MKNLLIVLLLLSTAHAQAMTCVFAKSSPSFEVTVRENTVIIANARGKVKTLPLISKTKEGKDIRVVFGMNIEENWVLAYTKNGRGSDGVTRKLYPYSATLQVGDTEAPSGGCDFRYDID